MTFNEQILFHDSLLQEFLNETSVPKEAVDIIMNDDFYNKNKREYMERLWDLLPEDIQRRFL